ncbi:uncharacterized protein MCYG_04381 [Microsporum canis CBS 113480]|uniref:Uncharacterized protein n=1 Tax=Arthroderma otae (strain ATCC MYA-4605 / CBS 113480) TaxID=554155 RepID=C5FNE8_ARTOC|nr:uncharacterized protein MCYG_04381 [Microsporum canis CBS 113480]EEQ31562.1 predicted protein [Microsporum canis CBS 113480]
MGIIRRPLPLPPPSGLRRHAFALMLIFLQPILVESNLNIATFTDKNCWNFQSSFDGPNGCPNGTYTELGRSVNHSSFQIVNPAGGLPVVDTFFYLAFNLPPSYGLLHDLVVGHQRYSTRNIHYLSLSPYILK